MSFPLLYQWMLLVVFLKLGVGVSHACGTIGTWVRKGVRTPGLEGFGTWALWVDPVATCWRVRSISVIGNCKYGYPYGTSFVTGLVFRPALAPADVALDLVLHGGLPLGVVSLSVVMGSYHKPRAYIGAKEGAPCRLTGIIHLYCSNLSVGSGPTLRWFMAPASIPSLSRLYIPELKLRSPEQAFQCHTHPADRPILSLFNCDFFASRKGMYGVEG